MATQDTNDKDIPEKESPDETGLFDQLQHEFDDLVSEDTQQNTVVHADIDDTLIEPEFEDSPLFLSQSDPSAPLPDIDNIDSKEWLPPPADTPATEPDDESNPLEDNTPLHPDMPGTREQRQGSNHFIAISSAIVLIMVGGIYWLATSTSHQQPDTATVTEQQAVAPDDKPSTPVPEPDTTQQAAASQSTDDTMTPPADVTSKTEAATQGSQHNQMASSVETPVETPVETRKAAIQHAAVEQAKVRQLAAKQASEKAKAEQLAAKQASEKAKAEQLAAKQASEKAKAEQLAAKQASEKAKAEQLAARQAAEKRASAKKAAARKIAVIRPSTQIQEQPLELQQASATATDKPGLWIIELASVNSDKSARQHMARIRAMGVESKAVQVNDKGRIFHSIRITGFSSKSEAMKRRNILIKLLGVRAAKVEKL